MKKLLLTTALIAVGSASFATGYNTAANVRDSLTTVYSDLDNTAVFGNSAAGQEYADLLHKIDNRGDVAPITVSFTSGLLTADGGEATGQFTLQEILSQVDVFVADLNNDLFGTTNYVEPADGSVATGPTSGLAGNKLNEIIMDIRHSVTRYIN